MLPASNRLRSSAEFSRTVRGGVRVGRPTLVVHALRRADALQRVDGTPQATRVGFVVSKAVGGAVVRNRVKRRLRALARPLVVGAVGSVNEPSQGGLSVVVRALPAAVTQPARLADDLSTAWIAACQKAVVQ